MLWALFLVNLSFTSCDDKNPEVQIGELTPQKLYQTSWRGTGRCDAWVVPNMGVGIIACFKRAICEPFVYIVFGL